MAVRPHKPSKVISSRVNLTTSPTHGQVRRRKSAARPTPHQLSSGHQDPESPIGTFAATDRPARLAGKENRLLVPAPRPVVPVTKRQRSHLQRVQFQSRPVTDPPPHSSKYSDESSDTTVDISLFPTNPPLHQDIVHDSQPSLAVTPRILVDQTVYLDNEPSLLELLSHSARSQSHSTVHHVPKHQAPDAETQIDIEIEYPPSCFTFAQAQHIARQIAPSFTQFGSVESGDPFKWTPISPDTIQHRHSLAQKVVRSISTSNACPRIVRYADLPPSTDTVCADIGLARRLAKPTQVADFTHREPATERIGCDAIRAALMPFRHQPRYAGYSPSASIPNSFKTKHVWGHVPNILALPGGPRQIVKLIIPFQGTPFMSSDLISSASFVHCDPSVDNDDPELRSVIVTEVAGKARPAILVWMQTTAHNFILALEQSLQSAVDESRFGPILHYTTSPPPTTSHECAYVTLYVHLDQIHHARALLATIDVVPSAPCHGKRPHNPVTPFASTHLSLLVLSTSGHPICLI